MGTDLFTYSLLSILPVLFDYIDRFYLDWKWDALQMASISYTALLRIYIGVNKMDNPPSHICKL